jgi:hypothetical protein
MIDWLARRFLWVVQDRSRVYRSFGCTRFFYPRVQRRQKAEARVLVGTFFTSNPSKEDLQEFQVGGTIVGDLIYDTYLRVRNVPTLSMTDSDLKCFTIDSVAEVLFWAELFEAGKIEAVITSHCVYNLAIPLRIALTFGVAAFQAKATSITRLSKERPFAADVSQDFANGFLALSLEEKALAIEQAQIGITRRFLAETKAQEDKCSSVSGVENEVSLLRQSDRSKIVIFAHCFSDSPHIFGNNLFPDFWEWLVFLGKLSETTDYDWYLKAHPDCQETNRVHLAHLTDLYPTLTLIPPRSSHSQIIRDGITAALTVYGTVGFEYAALGVPVINASINNPHKGYGFNYHPATIEDYEKAIRSVARLPRPGRRERSEVEEYYFMRYLHHTDDLFFCDFQTHVLASGGHQAHLQSSMYCFFLDQTSGSRHRKLVDTVGSYVLSDNRTLSATNPEAPQV